MASEAYDIVDKATINALISKIKAWKIPPGHIGDGSTDGASIYLAHHPEATTGCVIPFLYNDLAHLLEKGGAVEAYITTDSDLTAITLSKGTLLSPTAAVFDGAPSYWSFTLDSKTETVVVDITLHKTFKNRMKMYIDQCARGYHSQYVGFYAKKDSDAAYTLVGETAANSKGKFWCDYDNSAGINRLRVVMTAFASTYTRIAQIGLIQQSTAGATEVLLSRAGGDMYGGITPYTGLSLNLGSSSKRWNAIYGKTLNLSGAATVGSVTASGAGTFGSLKSNATLETGSLTVKATNAQGTLSGCNVTLVSPVQEYGGVNTYNVTLPSKAGTLALKSDLADYVPKTGGTLTGGLSLTTLAANEVTLGDVFRFYTSGDELRVEIGGVQFLVNLDLTPL